jgi:hypothetical protein
METFDILSMAVLTLAPFGVMLGIVLIGAGLAGICRSTGCWRS